MLLLMEIEYDLPIKSYYAPMSLDHCSTIGLDVVSNSPASIVFNNMKVIRPKGRSNNLFS